MSEYSADGEGGHSGGCFRACMREEDTDEFYYTESSSEPRNQQQHSYASSITNSKNRDTFEVAADTMDALRIQRTVVGTEIEKQEKELTNIKTTLLKLQERERTIVIALEKNKLTHENYGKIIAENQEALDRLRKAAVSIKSTMGGILKQAKKDRGPVAAAKSRRSKSDEDEESEGQSSGSEKSHYSIKSRQSTASKSGRSVSKQPLSKASPAKSPSKAPASLSSASSAGGERDRERERRSSHSHSSSGRH